LTKATGFVEKRAMLNMSQPPIALRSNRLSAGLQMPVITLLLVMPLLTGCMTVRGLHSDKRKVIVDTADRMLDTKYAYAKQSATSGFDCSGLTQYAYAKAGINIPITAKEQYRYARRISKRNLEEGDLVFFSTNGRGATHVGIYIGRGKFIHAASTSGKTRTDSLDDPYWEDAFYRAGTYF